MRSAGGVRAVILCVGITVSLSANLWLVAERAAAQRSVGQDGRSLLKTGDTVEAFYASDERGVRQRIAYADVPLTILYVMSPDCEWCRWNVENIKAIARQLDGRARVLGVSLRSDGLDEHIATANYPFPVVRDLAKEVIDAYAFGPTPQTIAIGQGGRVQRTWLGAYGSSETRSDLEAYLKVQLPFARPPL